MLKKVLLILYIYVNLGLGLCRKYPSIKGVYSKVLKKEEMNHEARLTAEHKLEQEATR